MPSRRFTTVIAATALSAVAAAGCTGAQEARSILGCTVVGADRIVDLTYEQASNAATIVAVGVRRSLPPRAMIVALATAWQESKLHNIDYGDRDSIGLFQQRPSQGWGSEEEIMDPRYAADTFYVHLERVPEWESMRVTDAAQTVQRSAFPEEYQQWADDSTVMVDAFLGVTPGALRCVGPDIDNGSPTDLSTALRLDWGDDTIVDETSDGITITVESIEDGWRFASWLVAHSATHGVTTVEFDGRQWHANTGDWVRPESSAPDSGMVIAAIR